LDESVPKGKRELIIEAAEKIFSEKGFFRAKVEEIAAEAGVGKGTVYEYFSSKEEVFKEMLLHISKDIRLKSKQSGDLASAISRIEEIVEEHLNFILRHRSMARVMMQEHLTMTDEIFSNMKKNRDDKLKALENIIIEGINKGEFRKDINPEVTAHLIFGATMSLSGDIIDEDGALTIRELTDHVVDMILYGIASFRDK
jgi:TetR/AcrR family fatty acid metabolism transcriptional regulator